MTKAAMFQSVLKKLEKVDMIVIANYPDENCLYRSIALQVLGSEDLHFKVHKAVLEYFQ